MGNLSLIAIYMFFIPFRQVILYGARLYRSVAGTTRTPFESIFFANTCHVFLLIFLLRIPFFRESFKS
jgi:hypothetical protein